MIDGLGSCKIIALGSVGVDSVDVEAATARGIPVTNCPDTFIEEVADHAMRLILATHGELILQDRLVREGRWAEGRPRLLKIPRLRGLTLGLIAFGHVARAVAERAKPFGLHIIAYDPFIEEMVMVERGVEPVSLPELLARADIISMHSPATASANRMIREEHFRQMKKTAIYVSTGRGPTTDEAALIKALDEGMIAGAGLDVLEQEPPGGNNPLLKMDNVILTAHVASATSRFDPARRRRVGQELSLVLTGRWPMSCVNRRCWPGAASGGGSRYRWNAARIRRLRSGGDTRLQKGRVVWQKGSRGNQQRGHVDDAFPPEPPGTCSRRLRCSRCRWGAGSRRRREATSVNFSPGCGATRSRAASGPATIEAAFQQIAFLPRVVELDRSSPSTR